MIEMTFCDQENDNTSQHAQSFWLQILRTFLMGQTFGNYMKLYLEISFKIDKKVDLLGNATCELRQR